MNRKERRAFQKEQHTFVKEQALPEQLTPVPRDEFPPIGVLPVQAWRSRKYLVQLWDESHGYHGMMRLSVCRVKQNASGRWQDGLTWDELQAIKREIGYGDWYAIEVYPRDEDIVNVANFRHLWLLPVPLPIGWFK
jgi:hypothetical protein